jgi:fatty acid-binding protein DegV
MPKTRLSDPGVRDRLIATLREVQAEKRAVHVIHFKDRWLVLSERAPGRRKSFEDQKGAIEHARGVARDRRFDLVVHGRDGSAQQVESFR